MIAQRAVLQINHSTYEILRCYYQFQRDTDAKNRPCSVYYGGSIVVELGLADDNTLFRRMVDKKMTPVSGAIEVFSGVGNRCIRRIAFEHAYVAAYGESTRVGHFAPVTVVVISPMRLDFDQHSLRLDRRWPQAPDGWQRYEEEKAPFAPVADAPPVPLVTAVKGEVSAIPHAVVEYRVTGYSLSGISESDKQRVKWQVGVDGKETLQKARGETLKLTIDEAWTGKEITVMPYLKTPTETVSVKTMINERLSLLFNGKFLVFRVVEQEQILRFSYKAVSGKPLKDGRFDYSKERQKVKDEGPIPEGKYHIDPQEIQYSNDRTSWEKFKGVFGGSNFPGGKSSWGTGRVWIEPKTIVVDNVVRGNFTIHGGDKPGSKGCIDITDNDKNFFRDLARYRKDATLVKLTVAYE